MKTKKLMSKFGYGLFLLLLELASFRVLKSTDIISMFALWSIIIFILLISNILEVNGIDRRVPGLSMVFIAHEKYITPEGDKESGGLFSNTNYTYLVFLIINISGFMISK